jgi:hypothetical protein
MSIIIQVVIPRVLVDGYRHVGWTLTLKTDYAIHSSDISVTSCKATGCYDQADHIRHVSKDRLMLWYASSIQNQSAKTVPKYSLLTTWFPLCTFNFPPRMKFSVRGVSVLKPLGLPYWYRTSRLSCRWHSLFIIYELPGLPVHETWYSWIVLLFSSAPPGEYWDINLREATGPIIYVVD